MHKLIDIKLTPIFSPICQALIHESLQDQIEQPDKALLDNCTELLIIRSDNTVIGYALFELTEGQEFVVGATYFRGIIKDHVVGEYCCSRLLQRRLENCSYEQFLLAS